MGLSQCRLQTEGEGSIEKKKVHLNRRKPAKLAKLLKDEQAED